MSMTITTQAELSDIVDISPSLASTRLEIGDWVVVAVLQLSEPQRLSSRFAQLAVISVILAEDETTYTLVDPSKGVAYAGLYKIAGANATLTSLDTDPATAGAADLVVVERPDESCGVVGFPLITGRNPAEPVAIDSSVDADQAGTYAVIVANNIDKPVEISFVGQYRVKLDAIA